MVNKIFIDAGAWNGISVSMFRKHWKNHEEFEIYSFECNPKYRNHFNKLNVNFINKAIWTYDGVVNFYLGNDGRGNDWGSTLIKNKITGNIDPNKPVEVGCIDFSKWIVDNFSKKDYIILKIDVEGAEWEVLPKMMRDGSIDYINELYGEWHVDKVGKTDVELGVMEMNLRKYNLKMRGWCAEKGIIEKNTMLIKYLSYSLMKYVRPIWYFHIIPHNGNNNVWIDYQDLSVIEKKIINYDSGYTNETLNNWDASYQALMKGVVKKTSKNFYTNDIEILPKDIYRFSRKYHKKIWIYLTFFQRILFSNPINELLGLWHTRKVQYIDIFKTYYNYGDYPNYSSKLIHRNPLVSIIIPTYNRYNSLKDLLDDIQKQIYTNYEIIVIDQSNPYKKYFYENLIINCNVIRQEKPSLWKARNKGIIAANSEYILLLDDDSRISSNWIAEHLKCIDYYNSDISSGVSFSTIGERVPENYSFFRWSDQLDTGNVLIKKEVFEKCGLFDEQFEKMRMGDGEFGLRAYLNGFNNISNPLASRIHLKIGKGGLRDMGHWDAFHTKNIFSLRPVPSVFYYWRKYYSNKTALLSCLITIPFSLTPYRYKGSYVGSIVSLLLFVLFLPIILIQVIFSWRKSTNMIKEGSIINNI